MDSLEGSISTGASAAPPPADSAATSSTPDVAVDSSAAASQSSEVAASTDSGARTSDDPLDALYEKYQSESTRSETEESAPAVVEPPKPEDTEKEEPAAGESEDDEPQTAEVDPLADEPTIPTREEIFKLRIPATVKAEYAEVAEKLAAREEAITAVGGEEGLAVAQAIIPHLFATEVTDENCHAIFNGIADANPVALSQMSQMFVQTALDDKQTGPAFADRLLESEYGEGYTAERISELVELDKQGLIDVAALREDLGAVRQPTARERELEQQAKELQEQVKQLTGDSKDATRKEEQRLNDTVRQSISKVVMDRVTPIAESVGWKGEGLLARLGKLATAELNAEIESTPEFNAVMALAEQNDAYRNGEPTRRMRAALERIGTRSEAKFKSVVRELKPVLEILAKQQKSAPQDAPPSEETGSRSGDPSRQNPPPPPRKSEAPPALKSTEEILEEKYRQFSTASKDMEAFSGRRGR